MTWGISVAVVTILSQPTAILASGAGWAYAGVFLFAIFVLLLLAFGVRYIPHDRVGIIEKYWSSHGSVKAGHIIAAHGEAGYQADVLRGGIHFFLPRWQFRIHKTSLVTIPQGKIGYVYARDGDVLQASQTLARSVECNNFQDARAFLAGGQRGRQRLILREGVYAM